MIKITFRFFWEGVTRLMIILIYLLFLSAALYLFFRLFSLIEMLVCNDEYLHCVQTHQLRPNISPSCAVSLTTAPETENPVRVKIPHIHTFHNRTQINLESKQCLKFSEKPNTRYPLKTVFDSGQSRAEGGVY